MKTIAKAFLVVLLVCGASQGAAPMYVTPTGSGDGSSWGTAANINAAVLAAPAGCTVYVTNNATYTLTNQLAITNFTIQSYGANGLPDRDHTFINGNFPNFTNRCFYLNHANAVVDGFTITNGYCIGNGGGVCIDTAGGTLRNCLVMGNTATNAAGGGGVYAYGASSMITNCDIIGNAAWRDGGGAYLVSAAKMWNCRVMRNRLAGVDQASGGGLFANGAAVWNCSIISNSVPSFYSNQGGGAYLTSGSTLRNCLIMGNSNPFGNCSGSRPKAGGHLRVNGGASEPGAWARLTRC